MNDSSSSGSLPKCSITIDKTLLDEVGLKENQKVEILNINNGERFSTYVIEGNNYLDKDYLVSIEVKKGNTTAYSRGKRVNGTLLNEGDSIELDGVTYTVKSYIIVPVASITYNGENKEADL